MAQQDSTFIYKQELGGALLSSPKMLETLINGNPAIFKVTLERLLAASGMLSPSTFFSTEASSFSEDLHYMQLRRIMVGSIQYGDVQVKELAIKTLLRLGVIRASPEDLMLAAQLMQKYKVDCSSELEAFCKSSEVFTPPADPGSGDYVYSEEVLIQSRVSFNGARGDSCDKND